MKSKVTDWSRVGLPYNWVVVKQADWVYSVSTKTFVHDTGFRAMYRKVGYLVALIAQ